MEDEQFDNGDKIVIKWGYICNIVAEIVSTEFNCFMGKNRVVVYIPFCNVRIDLDKKHIVRKITDSEYDLRRIVEQL